MAPNIFRDVIAPKIEIKQNWSDAWSVDDSGLILLSATRSIPSQDVDSANFRFHYGRVKDAGKVVFKNKDYVDFDKWWVKISLFNADPDVNDYELAWQGRFEVEDRRVHGKVGDAPASGVLELTAYGGYQLLRKRTVSKSFHRVSTTANTTQEIGWLPAMNYRDSRNILVGNRSQLKGTVNSHSFSAYLFGNEQTWNAYEFLEYLIRYHLPDGDDNPRWQIELDVSHTRDVLVNLKDNFAFQEVANVADIMHEIIPRRLGVDFNVQPTDDGFKIQAFSLQKDAVEFDSVSLPANPNTLDIDAASLGDTRVTLEKTGTHRYKTIRVIGARIVCCGTFQVGGPSATGADIGWTSAEVTEYQNGTGSGSDSAQDHDQARQRESLQHVFGRFIANKNINQLDRKYFPKVFDASNGTIDTLTKADAQSAVRETLSWLPLRKNWDYTTDPPTAPGDADDTEQGYMAPQAWVNGYTYNPSGQWFAVDKEPGREVRPLESEWGIQLTGKANHIIAGANFTATKPSRYVPAFTYDNMRFTIAWQSDQRLQLSYNVSDADDSLGIMEIHLPDAELWYAASGTVFDVALGNASFKQTAAPVELRNDSERLKRAMAGAKARYTDPRYRATISVHGLALWYDKLGHLITTINDGASSADMQSVVTSIRWDFERTQGSYISAGYAT